MAVIQCDDCDGPGCETCGGTGERPIGTYPKTCARHCNMCDGSDHHWDYFGEQSAEGDPLMSCKHCPALRLFTQDDDANCDY